MPAHWEQSEYDLRCEWGLPGMQALQDGSEVLIVVDVLVFSTAVDIAISRGAFVLPYCWRDSSAAEYAQSRGAILAGSRTSRGYSLSPLSLASIPPGTSLVLPSPNGSAICAAGGAKPVIAGCLRNCSAVAAAAMARGSRIAVIPAGEQWEDERLRPALEDLVGAGALLAHLKGRPSPEAEAAIAAFERFRYDLPGTLRRTTSGKELEMRGFGGDVECAAELDVSRSAPLLHEGASYRAWFDPQKERSTGNKRLRTGLRALRALQHRA